MRKTLVSPNALVWLVLSVVVIILDQLTKEWVLKALPEFQPITVIDGFWNWYRTYNKGAAFSFLSNAGGWQHFLFSGLAIVISLVLMFWLSRTPRKDWQSAIPFALVIGGALSNVIDRFRHGHVVDFIQWYYGDFYWPAFNIADAAIVGGAVMMVVFSLFSNDKPETAKV